MNGATLFLVQADDTSEVARTGAYSCALSGTAIGTRGTTFIPFAEIMADTDAEPTRFCMMCLDWLKEIRTVL